MIYFDNAATTAVKPPNVVKAVNTALKQLSANPGRSGHTLSVKTAEAVYSVRERVADFFGATGPERVIFTLNCTHSLNCVIKGILRPGDHTVVSSLEHNAVMRPLKKTGTSFDAFEVSLYDNAQTLTAFERALKPNTRLCVCTGASNVLGKILPLKEIGEICRRRGILFCVDAAQIAGVEPIKLKEMNIDYLCIAPHKGLYAPTGTGLLICEAPLNNTLIEGGTGTNSIEWTQPLSLPERHESGTLNVPGIMGVGAGIAFVKSTGIEKIRRHEMKIIGKIYAAFEKNPQIELYTPSPEKYNYAPVLSFNFKGIDSLTAAEYLSENGIAVRGGLHCAPTAHRQIGTLPVGTVRISAGAFNTEAEADSLIRLTLNEKNIKKLKKSIE